MSEEFHKVGNFKAKRFQNLNGFIFFNQKGESVGIDEIDLEIKSLQSQLESKTEELEAEKAKIGELEDILFSRGANRNDIENSPNEHLLLCINIPKSRSYLEKHNQEKESGE